MASVRGRRHHLPLWAAFAAGTTLGGAFTGSVLGVLSGLLSPIPQQVRLGVLAVAVVALVVLDLTSRALPLPQRGELIPQDVFHRGMRRGAFRFGLEYGTGFRTLVPSAAPYVVALLVLLAIPPWWWALVLGSAFGAARSLAIAQRVLIGSDGWTDFLAGHSRSLERVGTVVAAGLALLAAVQLTGA